MLSDLIAWVKRLEASFRIQEGFELRALSNKLIEEAALKNDKVLVKLSVVSYALHKILNKVHFTKSPNWEKVKKTILGSLQKAVISLENKKIKEFEKNLNAVTQNISKIDAEIGNFAQNLVEKGRLKKASEAYSFGMSLSKAVELTQTDRKQLLNYIGGTRMHDEHPSFVGIKKRVGFLKKVFE